ncbi:BREX system P-loop protein BrxC [Vreelandella indica]|uniref:BREX system P-loop protein BrxC n=1 Tax=Vreelandella indica TaxID=3126500 RepID=UPI00300DCD45
MTLKDIFLKRVDRTIEGVIKADDEASLRLEIEEYVLTNEVEKRLEDFLDAYNNYEGANGVWVSGFFGSGKSHLLKMLALLLENREMDGTSTLDRFLPKCNENEILRAGLKRAVSIPSKSILFNIDQKADVISKTQIDALLAVFVKVFDEMCGYYGKQGHIAQFERDLDSRGLYPQFKDEYESMAGRTWQKGREQALLEGPSIAKAYAAVTGADQQSAMGILDKYRSEYRVSIEDFADNVNDYIKEQAAEGGHKEFRLNFFVDEVGQYIADNIKLMTNLQTIAESLATKCKGRAWIVVTAQEEMKNVVGELGNQQGNDFSKIQARFNNRMKLSSADVAEVIQKRLLTKTEEGVNQLTDVYHVQSNNFKTLFDFADGSATYRNFRDRDHFIHSYPFVPYQFALFQSAIQNLSEHSAFEGKHSSVGERSMLGVFQQVAVHIGGHEVGQLATFDLMFEGIRSALKSQIQRAIIQAENHLDGPFAIRLLKSLFLVKYVKEFKPTVRNLCVLMLDAFDQDLPALRKKIEEALSLLEQQTYIQRNGDQYEYLTDEEKDVEQEIKNTEVESTDIADELEKIIFDYVIKQRKIRYDAGSSQNQGQDYTYSRKLDDRLHGREYELAINVISPFHEHTDNEQMLRTASTYKADELFVLMPSDERLVRDLLMLKRTEKYIKQNISVTQQESVKRILNDKGFQNREREARLRQQIQALLGKSKLLIGGADVEVTNEDPQTRIIRGFHELIVRSYPNLRMLRGISYSENDIGNCLKRAEDGLFGNDATALAESDQEVLAFIQSNNRGGVRTTLKGLLEKFERKPYGWNYAAILCNLANLWARGKVEIRLDGNILEDAGIERALRNTHGHSNLVLEPQIEFTASQVRTLKAFYEDFFDAPPNSSEAKALGNETSEAFQEMLHQLTPLAVQAGQYPFMSALNPAMKMLKDLAGKPYTWHLTELRKHEDELLELKEEAIDPIRKFMSGSQKDIYNQARSLLQTQEPNFIYVPGDEIEQIHSILNDPNCYKGNRIQQLKGQLDSLQKRIDEKVNQTRSSAVASLNTMQERMQSMDEYQSLPESRWAELNKPFQDLNEHIRQQQLIAVINDRLRFFEDEGYQKVLARMVALANQKAAPSTDPEASPEPESIAKQDQVKEPSLNYVHSRNIHVVYDKAWLADEGDVDRYLNSLREALLQEIQKGHKVQI